jgi:hypothetical protein
MIASLACEAAAGKEVVILVSQKVDIRMRARLGILSHFHNILNHASCLAQISAAEQNIVVQSSKDKRYSREC